MSVWRQSQPVTTSLAGSEGALVSVSIHTDPRDLESLLEALAAVSFPINPEIYHEAAFIYIRSDGREETHPTTLVEFPAYEPRLPEVRVALEAHGFDAACLHVTAMLDAIHLESASEPVPAGGPYVARRRVRHHGAGVLVSRAGG